MDNTAVESALSQETFDVLSFVQQVAYPTKFVTIFTDVATAKEYRDAALEFHSSEEKQSPEAVNEHDELMAKFAAKLEETALTFKLRGYPGGIVQEIMKQYNTDEDPNGGDNHLIAKAIIEVKQGNKSDPSVWDAAKVQALRDNITEGEYLKLMGGVADVIFTGAIFDQAADAGFPSGRPDMASELQESASGTDSVHDGDSSPDVSGT